MEKHTYKNGHTTSFEYIKFTETPKFTILYTHGLCSDPWGEKPENVKKWCIQNNINFYRYELAGHGSDKDTYMSCGVNDWRDHILDIIDNIITGPILVVGSSLGGWLSLLATIHRPQRIVGVIGLAAAPDFTKYLRDYLSIEQNRELDEKGFTAFDNADFGYFYTTKLIESGNQNLVLETENLNINCPVHLIHGIKDASIPYQHAINVTNKLSSTEVILKILKESNHRLNDDLAKIEIINSLNWFLER